MKKYLLLILVVTIASCTVKPLVTEIIGEKNNKQKILIASQISEFKDAIVSKVVEELKNEDSFIKLIDLKKLEKEASKDYNAIVIINTGHVWQISAHVKHFVKNIKEKEKEKIVLLTTVGGEIWKPKMENIDSLSSASKMEKSGLIAGAVIKKVKAILNKPEG